MTGGSHLARAVALIGGLALSIVAVAPAAWADAPADPSTVTAGAAAPNDQSPPPPDGPAPAPADPDTAPEPEPPPAVVAPSDAPDTVVAPDALAPAPAPDTVAPPDAPDTLAPAATPDDGDTARAADTAPADALAADALAPIVVAAADNEPVAWINGDVRTPPTTTLTLQQALTSAAPGDRINVLPGTLTYTRVLSVPSSVTLDAESATTIFGRFTVAGGGLAAASTVAFGVTASNAVVTVNAADATLTGIHVVNPNGVARPTGIQLGAGVAGVTIDAFTMEGGDQALSFGVNLATGSARVLDATISGVATGVGITAASIATGIDVQGGTFTTSLVGVALGASRAPNIADVAFYGADAGTGIDLARSSAATIADVAVHGYARGIGATATSTESGPSIERAVVTGARTEGIAVGSTSGATITAADVTGTGVAASIGINLHLASAVVLDRPAVRSVAIGIATNLGNTTTAGPHIVAPDVSDVTVSGISLGSTWGAVVTDAVIAGGPAAAGINLMGASHLSVTNTTATGMLYGIGGFQRVDPTLTRDAIVIDRVQVDGAVAGSSGVYVTGTRGVQITHVTAEVAGGAVVLHDAEASTIADVTVTGHAGPTSTSGAAVVKAYDSTGITLTRTSIVVGSYGFFFSHVSGVEITGANTVSNVTEYGFYGRSLTDASVDGATFTDNGAVGYLAVTTPGDGPAGAVSFVGNTMTGNRGGVSIYSGATDVAFTGNVVSGQPNVVTASPVRGLVIADNTIAQPADATAISLPARFDDPFDRGSYSSSSIEIRDNVFSGDGTALAVGTLGGTNRVMRDTVTVVGNTFPAGSDAVRTFANAMSGDDVGTAGTYARDVAGDPVVVDARDQGNPNDWGSVCRATGILDGVTQFAGEGATVDAVSGALVAYPRNCIELSLVESLSSSGLARAAEPAVRFWTGDEVTWTLTPRNGGLMAAPAGWSVVPLLPDGVVLVSLTGDGYEIDGGTATATGPLQVGVDGPALTVVVQITARVGAPTTMKDVAYVAPRADATDVDGDGFGDVIVEHLSPLVVPTLDTDTDSSATDNDTEGSWTLLATPAAPPVPVPPDPAPVVDPVAPSDPAVASEVLADEDDPELARTGDDVGSLAAWSALLVGAGALVLVRLRRRRAGADGRERR